MSLETNADGNEVQKVKIAATGGNDLLGGKDWDDKLFDHILQACCDENGLAPDEIDAETRQLIRGKVEPTKKKLSTAESAKVKVNVNGSMTSVTITREEFENLTADKVTQTMNYVDTTLQEAGNIEIDTVLLAGGSTYMPMIRNAVEAKFPSKVQIHEPDRAVAMGAAIYGRMWQEKHQLLLSRNVKKYRPELIAEMIGYALDHSNEELAKELIADVDWEWLTPEQLFDFFDKTRRSLKGRECKVDNEYKMLYIEKLLKASVIAMDAPSPAASGYLLREIPWQTLSAGEILGVIKLARNFPRKDFQ